MLEDIWRGNFMRKFTFYYGKTYTNYNLADYIICSLELTNHNISLRLVHVHHMNCNVLIGFNFTVLTFRKYIVYYRNISTRKRKNPPKRGFRPKRELSDLRQ